MNASFQNIATADEPFPPMQTGRIVFAPQVTLDPMAGTLASVAQLPGQAYSPPSGAFAGVPVLPPVVNICILALDLGTKTGYALRRRDGTLVHGTEDFTPRASWGRGQRGLRFRSWLGELLAKEQPHAISYEEVMLHQGVLAAHMYGLFEGLVWMAAETRNIAVTPHNFGHIKKHWTGAGNAKKDVMVAQAKARGFRVVDDNDADALAILHLAMAREAGTWTAPAKKPKPKTKRAPMAQKDLL